MLLGDFYGDHLRVFGRHGEDVVIRLHGDCLITQIQQETFDQNLARLSMLGNEGQCDTRPVSSFWRRRSNNDNATLIC